jgi:hypothetical protein
MPARDRPASHNLALPIVTSTDNQGSAQKVISFRYRVGNKGKVFRLNFCNRFRIAKCGKLKITLGKKICGEMMRKELILYSDIRRDSIT